MNNQGGGDLLCTHPPKLQNGGCLIWNSWVVQL